MIRWLKASLYRKLILSHVGVLLFLFVLGMVTGTIAYRIHILDLLQQRFAKQTRIMFNHMREEFDIIRQTHTPTVSPPKRPPRLLPRREVSQGKTTKPPARPPANGIRPMNLALLATACQRVQESSVVLSALVSIQNEDGTCLMEAHPWSFQIYWPRAKKLLPKACLRPFTSRASGPAARYTKSSQSPGYGTHQQVTITKHKHRCHLLQRKHRWSWRHRIAHYTYRVSPDSRYKVTYVLIQRLHRPGPLPWIWVGFAVLLVIGIGLLTIPISRSITRPLRELMQTVRHIQSGDLNREVQVKAHDEVGELAQAVDEMRSSLLLNRQQRRALITDISHEIRTPLARIRVVGESVADGLMREPDKLTQAMEGICKQVDEIDQLIGDLLDIARLELSDPGQLTYQNIHLDQLLTEMKRTLDPAAQAAQKHLLLGDIPPDLPPVEADFRRLRQVFNNLIQNAIRYSPEDGKITLSARVDGGWMRCEVCDQGAGVPEAEREKIFERLYRTDSSRSRQTGGQGLGLAIVKQIIAAHHGEVGVSDAPEGGACFWFKIPLKQPRS